MQARTAGVSGPVLRTRGCERYTPLRHVLIAKRIELVLPAGPRGVVWIPEALRSQHLLQGRPRTDQGSVARVEVGSTLVWIDDGRQVSANVAEPPQLTLEEGHATPYRATPLFRGPQSVGPRLG